MAYLHSSALWEHSNCCLNILLLKKFDIILFYILLEFYFALLIKFRHRRRKWGDMSVSWKASLRKYAHQCFRMLLITCLYLLYVCLVCTHICVILFSWQVSCFSLYLCEVKLKGSWHNIYRHCHESASLTSRKKVNYSTQLVFSTVLRWFIKLSWLASSTRWSYDG